MRETEPESNLVWHLKTLIEKNWGEVWGGAFGQKRCCPIAEADLASAAAGREHRFSRLDPAWRTAQSRRHSFSAAGEISHQSPTGDQNIKSRLTTHQHWYYTWKSFKKTDLFTECLCLIGKSHVEKELDNILDRPIRSIWHLCQESLGQLGEGRWGCRWCRSIDMHFDRTDGSKKAHIMRIMEEYGSHNVEAYEQKIIMSYEKDMPLMDTKGKMKPECEMQYLTEGLGCSWNWTGDSLWEGSPLTAGSGNQKRAMRGRSDQKT